MVETKEFIVFVRNVTVLLVMITIQIETTKLLGAVLFGKYYLTTISMINMEMQFGDSFQVNDNLGGYQVYKENTHQFSNITL